ncbi:MAG TPA: hypothetical protein VFK09_00460 [Gemmatimonadales bacterium]|jgi:hypothetical protein|nr:hypothetical protein [Gemmatimonadales bacterium]
MRKTHRNTLLGAVMGALAIGAGTTIAVAQDTTSQTGQSTEMPKMPGQGGAVDTAGYSGVERDTSHQTRSAQDTSRTATTGQDTTRAGNDSTKWGYPVDTTGAQNPPGYRGMERPEALDSAQRATGDTTYQSNPTSRTSQRERQDSLSQPPNAAGQDTSRAATPKAPQQGGAADTAGYTKFKQEMPKDVRDTLNAAGKTTNYKERKQYRAEPSATDTSAGAQRDTSATRSSTSSDSTRMHHKRTKAAKHRRTHRDTTGANTRSQSSDTSRTRMQSDTSSH